MAFGEIFLAGHGGYAQRKIWFICLLTEIAILIFNAAHLLVMELFCPLSLKC